jgi:hypothetical protein
MGGNGVLGWQSIGVADPGFGGGHDRIWLATEPLPLPFTDRTSRILTKVV